MASLGLRQVAGSYGLTYASSSWLMRRNSGCEATFAMAGDGSCSDSMRCRYTSSPNWKRLRG